MTDQRWMRRCLELAAQAEGHTSPNPMVGCVIVGKDGELIAEGYHRRPGTDHAEADALKAAGERARGATLYVNLEPCNHHGRTGPCAPAVAAAGVAKVVYGADDPIAGHAGGGAYLREQGVDVVSGVLASEARTLNRGFFSVAARKRPWVVAKAAMTLDGRIATKTGESKWITSEQARARGRELRAKLDAIVVGIGTALADDPRLTARADDRSLDPVRVVVNSTLRTPSAAKLLPANAESEARCIIAGIDTSASAEHEARLTGQGAEVWRMAADSRGKVNLRAVHERLANTGINSVLVEGGGELIASHLQAGLVDEMHVFIAPVVVGGPAPGWFGGGGVAALADALRLEPVGKPESIGSDLLWVLRPAG